MNPGGAVDVRLLNQAELPSNALSSNVIEARRRFNEAFTHRRVQLRRQWIMGLLLMILMVTVSSILGEVDLVHIGKKIFIYIARGCRLRLHLGVLITLRYPI